MKSFITFAGVASAALNVTINDDSVVRTASQVSDFMDNFTASNSTQQTLRSLYELGVQNDAYLFSNQKDMLRPIANNIKIYQQYLTPGRKCKSDDMAVCLMSSKVDPYGDNWYSAWEMCARENNCTAKYEDLSQARQQRLEKKFNKNGHQLEKAMEKYQRKTMRNVQTAQRTYGADWMKTGMDIQKEAVDALNAWGCKNQTCVAEYTAMNNFMIDRAISECQCPPLLTIDPAYIENFSTEFAETETEERSGGSAGFNG